MSDLVLIAEITAQPGRRAALRQALDDLIAPTRAEPGCRAYHLHVVEGDPDRFVFLERWADREAWGAHRATAHIAAFRVKAESLVASFRVTELTPLD